MVEANTCDVRNFNVKLLPGKELGEQRDCGGGSSVAVPAVRKPYGGSTFNTRMVPVSEVPTVPGEELLLLRIRQKDKDDA
jgi:hypothetical protein